MDINTVDIGSKAMAQKVHQAVNAEWYENMLQALQKEATRLGYMFVKTQSAEELPPIVTEQLAYVLILQRNRFLYPLEPKDEAEYTAQQKFEDGFAQSFLRSVLHGLAESGIGLQAGVNAAEQIRAEEARRSDLWIRCAHDLLAAVRMHVGYEFPKLSDETEKMEKIEALLKLSDFDAPRQLAGFLSRFPHDRDKQMGWVDFAGNSTTTCPDIPTLVAPMFTMSNTQVRAITVLALEKFRLDTQIAVA